MENVDLKFVATVAIGRRIKFIPSVSFFSRKQCVSFHNLQRSMKFTHISSKFTLTVGDFSPKTSKVYTFSSISTKKDVN